MPPKPQPPRRPPPSHVRAGADPDLVTKAQQRLQEQHSEERSAEIQRLTEAFGLSDEVALALRMLTEDMINEVLAGESALAEKIQEVPDKTAMMMSLISQLDPEVENMVRELSALDNGGGRPTPAVPVEAAAHAGETEVPDADTAKAKAVQEARRRLAVPKSREQVEAIQNLKQDFGLGDEVELALKMLGVKESKELLAGVADIRERLQSEDDPGALLMRLVAMLDPEAESIARTLSDLDDAGPSSGGTPSGGENDAFHQAMARLEAHKTQESWEAIGAFKERLGLGDEVELALRMLSAEMLQEVLAGEDALAIKLQEVDDSSVLMMKLISQLDPDVEYLVNRLLQMDRGGGEEDQSVQEPPRKVAKQARPPGRPPPAAFAQKVRPLATVTRTSTIASPTSRGGSLQQLVPPGSGKGKLSSSPKAAAPWGKGAGAATATPAPRPSSARPTSKGGPAKGEKGTNGAPAAGGPAAWGKGAAARPSKGGVSWGWGPGKGDWS